MMIIAIWFPRYLSVLMSITLWNWWRWISRSEWKSREIPTHILSPTREGLENKKSIGPLNLVSYENDYYRHNAVDEVCDEPFGVFQKKKLIYKLCNSIIIKNYLVKILRKIRTRNKIIIKKIMYLWNNKPCTNNRVQNRN